MFNNINNENINNAYPNNNLFSPNNNYFQNDKQNKEKQKKVKEKNLPKRTNYIPKNFLINQSPNSQNQNYPNQYIPISYQNMPYNYQNMNQVPNTEKNYQQQPKNNYSQDNEIDNNFRNIITEIKNDENNINKDTTNNKVYQIFSYIFNDKIKDVAEVFTDENLLKIACPSEIVDNIEFSKDKFKKNGDTVLLRWKKFYNCKLIFYNQYWGNNTISYSFKIIEMEPGNIGSLQINLKYYYNTCQNNTLYIMVFIMDKGIFSEVFKEELIDEDLRRICRGVEKILRDRKKERIHVSSLIINTPKERVWNCITNLNKQRYINYMNKYNLYYLYKDEIKLLNDPNNKSLEKEIKENNNKYDHIQKGDCIVIKKNTNEIFSKLIVDEIKEQKDKSELFLVSDKSDIQSNNNKNDKNENIKNKENIEVLNQKIVLSVKEITKDICFLEYKHIWHDWVNINKINTLDIFKANSLKVFEQLLFKSNNETINKDNEVHNSVISLFNLLCPIEL